MRLKRWITGWHLGQLVMAWLAGGFMAYSALVAGDMVIQSSGAIEGLAELARRDSVARTPPHAQRISDSLSRLALANADGQTMDAYLRSEGLRDESFQRPSRGEQVQATMHKFLLGLPLILIAGILPIGLFAATWTWFGGRSEGRSLMSSAAHVPSSPTAARPARSASQSSSADAGMGHSTRWLVPKLLVGGVILWVFLIVVLPNQSPTPADVVGTELASGGTELDSISPRTPDALDALIKRRLALHSLRETEQKKEAEEYEKYIRGIGQHTSAPSAPVKGKPTSTASRDGAVAVSRAVPGAGGGCPDTWTRPRTSEELLPTRSTGRGQLSIVTGDEYDAVVGLRDAATDVTVRRLYVRSGERGLMTQIAPGRYRLRFVLGRKWWAKGRRFCVPASASEFDRTLVYEEMETETGTRYSRQEVTLYQVRDGNTSLRRVDPNEPP